MSKIQQFPNETGQRLRNPALSGVSRRDFLKFCTVTAATLGLPLGMGKVIAQTITNPKRTPVIWLHFQECTGCTETLLRATHPTVERLILDVISVDYSETLMAAAGHQAEEAMHNSIKDNEGKFILVVEGSIPTAMDGIYCKIAGRTALDILNEIGPKAAAIVAIGSCASWGGVQSSGSNPTEAKGVKEILPDAAVINLPGCPASPYNLLSTILYYLTLNKLPQLDKMARPLFAYGKLVHDNCERRPHFNMGQFAEKFGDYGHKNGWCLYKLGCKGPETHANCPVQLFGDVGSNAWPVGTGHPCFGCSEKDVGFTKFVHEQAEVYSAYPPEMFPDINQDKGSSVGFGAGLATGAAVGAAAVAGIKISKALKETESDSEDEKE